MNKELNKNRKVYYWYDHLCIRGKKVAKFNSHEEKFELLKEVLK